MSEHTIRRNNLLALYAKFVVQSQADDPGASVHGLDGDFALRIGLSKSSLSSHKTGARPIGPKIARQIEAKMATPSGWMDIDHSKHQPSDDEVELARFLKLAARFYKRSSVELRNKMAELLRGGS